MPARRLTGADAHRDGMVRVEERLQFLLQEGNLLGGGNSPLSFIPRCGEGQPPEFDVLTFVEGKSPWLSDLDAKDPWRGPAIPGITHNLSDS